MTRKIFQRLFRHLFFAAVGQQLRRLIESHPFGTRNFYAHLFGNVVDLSGFVLQQVEAYDLEDPLLSPHDRTKHNSDVGKFRH